MKKCILSFLTILLQLTVIFSNSRAQSGPVANFRVSDSIICAGDCISFTDESTGSPIIWNWEFPGANPSSSTVQNPPYVCYRDTGIYSVKLVVANSNGIDSTQHFNYIKVTLCTGINNIAPTAEPTFYPNPFNDNLAVTPGKNYPNSTIILYDALGRKIYQQQLNSDNTFSIHTVNYPSGIYFISIISPNGKSVTQRLIKVSDGTQ